MVNVTGLGQTDDGVDQDIGLARASRADGQLTVSTVHGVAGLESDDAGPAQLVEVDAQLSGGVYRAIRLVFRCLDGPRLAGMVLKLHFSVPIRAGEKHTAQTDIVVVVQLVDSLDLATNVQLLDSLVEVNDSRVLGVTAKDEFTLLLPRIRGKTNTSATRSTKKHEPPVGTLIA